MPGFRLPYQRIVAVGADLAQAQAIVRHLLPWVTPAARAAAYHERRIEKAKTLRVFGRESFRAVEAGSALRWLNIAVGAEPLAQAGFQGPGRTDRSFGLGLARRSSSLGDPSTLGAPGHKDGWLVGAPSAPVALLLILGSDEAEELARFADSTEKECRRAGGAVLYAETGVRLDNDSEHFGFRDGVSQPGLRGRLSPAEDDLLTPRRLAPDGLSEGPEFSAPGEVLVWPGEFIFGYPRQDAHDFRTSASEGPVDPFMSGGSFLVFRRLRQHVALFRQATRTLAESLRAYSDYAGASDDWLRARLVGRWPSGAPILLYPDDDPGTPPGSLDAFNNFGFREAAAAVTTTTGEPIPGAPGDPMGLVCPLHAHIRKVNPRDTSTNLGPPSQTQKLRLLRRGIPYGTPIAPDAVDEDGVDRGLLFLSYQRSIREQFEKLAQDWMNSDIKPEADGGHDVLVGQAPLSKEGRTAVFRKAAGSTSRRVSTLADWVTPTGGGYFFAPSLASLAAFAGNQTEV
ncbi:Dyp-type peroxidase [Methylobacterium planeticum]|uniref:Dyp-type peroxidase n=1 Tax=Methylobacterium planeticum TaxID=2615211 RepID=UPI00177E31BA|nr:Dyp-type peroxidase [Methylobacterium planeticum]